MANVTKHIRVTEAIGEDDLPPPPPPAPGHHLEESLSNRDSSFQPVPPPKETFSTFYQQRQKSELKRLFKHIHPELRKNLDDATDDDIIETMHFAVPETAESGYQGEVQSMRWIFENWTLDNIGDPHATKKLLDEENLQGGDVRGTSSMFEHCIWDGTELTSDEHKQGLVKGDVRTATWLFETQPLDILSKSSHEEGELVEALLKEPIIKGDVTGARHLFETKPLDALGRCYSVEDQRLLRLKSELQEEKGDVKKTVKLFQADPKCALRDSSGNIHEIRNICREEIKSRNIKTARWLFETQPLDVINKNTSGIQIIRGISLEEAPKGGVDRKKWIFETQPLDAIHEGAVEEHKFQGTSMKLSDVGQKQGPFETQPLDMLNAENTPSNFGVEKEDVLGGNVKSTLWLFETQPIETLKDSFEVGNLKKVMVSSDERGEVKDKKQTFENFNLITLQADNANTVKDVEKGSVKSYKHLFETIPIDYISQTDNEHTEKFDITAGSVKGNKDLFESTPLYAIKDCSGNFHEVKNVSREEIIKGNVQNYKWMFETKPLDQFEEVNGTVEVIKGITRQEDTTADVRMAKWLFETQPLEAIHLKFNKKNSLLHQEESAKGDVKTFKWLFETQPMDILYEKSEKKQETETIPKANVKSQTWLFETQPLDNIKDKEEQCLKLCSTVQDDLTSDINVRTVKHLFETETLDRITSRLHGSEQDVRYVSQVNVQSGDVSRVKEIFETQSLDEIGCEITTVPSEDEPDKAIQTGSVHKFTWLFENQPISAINTMGSDRTKSTSVIEVGSGDVGNKKFIFETFSLDKIKDKDQLLEHQSMNVEKPISGGDVKSSTMLFESQPLYAIRDKDGEFHEVTTVKKDEVMSGDVRGARWMFETKPLDAIQADKEIYIIRAVTQEDVLKGAVKSARWKFETQPLNSFTSRDVPTVKVVEEISNVNNVQVNKKLFESEQAAHNKFVRMVSVTDVQHGDVRTSTWLFENQPIDTLKGDQQEQSDVKTVQREDKQKGDVKRCTWLFESQPLDKIKDEQQSAECTAQEERPKADVKSTTWLFETTPLDKITVDSVTETLCHLHQLKCLHSSGIIIQANGTRHVNMAKFLFVSDEGPKVEKEEVVEGQIRNIMLQLLHRPNMKHHVTVLNENEEGTVDTSFVEIPQQQSETISPQQKQSMETMFQIIESALVQNKFMESGLVMQESEGKQAEMTIYCFHHHHHTAKMDSHNIQKGDVKSTIGNLLATAQGQRDSGSCRLEENERGNVDLYRRCIEKGDLQYLKSLQTQLSEDEFISDPKEQIEVVQGDVKQAMMCLKKQKEQVERTIQDVVSGDVKNVKKMFLGVPSDVNIEHSVPKEDIICGNVSTVKQQLDDAAKQHLVVEKEEIVSGDIKATLESLERAKQQSMHVEKEVITPGTIYDLDMPTVESPADERQNFKEEIISGDVKAAKLSLEKAKNQSMRVERETVMPGKIYNLNISSHDEQSVPTVMESNTSSFSNQRITTTHHKVSDTEGGQGAHDKFEACPQSAECRISVTKVETVEARSADASLCVSPYIMPESEVQNAEEVRGDVKAAIRSLHSAAKVQRAIDKEEIVQGNIQAALQSLERSSVNVSKGDYKAAMIYRTSGQPYTEERKKMYSGSVYSQNVVVSMPPSDNKLSPSVSVTCKEEQSSTALNSAPVISDRPLESSKKFTSPKPFSLSNERQSPPPPPPPPKTCNQDQDSRPALPPKPQWSNTRSGVRAENPFISTQLCDSHPKGRISHDMKQLMRAHVVSVKPYPEKKISSTESGGDPDASAFGVSATDEPTDMLEQQKQGEATSDDSTVANSAWKVKEIVPKMAIEKNVIQKINAAEEINMYMQSYSTDGDAKQDMNTGFRLALQNFGGKKKGTVENAFMAPKKIKVVQDKEINMDLLPSSSADKENTSESCGNRDASFGSPDTHHMDVHEPEAKVVLREKKVKRETDEERLQRLSIHKEEIMRGNVKAAMEIFENLRKREELKSILCQVQEIEGETSEVDVGSLRDLYEDEPSWVADPSKEMRPGNIGSVRKANAETESLKDETESICSVDTVFEDLEKASMDIMQLKEQTLTRLVDIEEAIKKALYSVSNLKSEADIAGLSGLFNESLKTEQQTGASSNIRKISIVTSKAKTNQSKAIRPVTQHGPEPSDVQTEASLPKCKAAAPKTFPNLPSSPSFISIHSAARKSADTPKPPHPSPAKSKPKSSMASSNGHQVENGDHSSEKETVNHSFRPKVPKRKVSVLEVQTIPEPAGIVGTKMVSEKYEETDCYGNKIVTSSTSTVVTKKCHTNTSSYEVVSSPKRYESTASPLMHRSGRLLTDVATHKTDDRSKVFVTFGSPKPSQH
ncbi:xin actin-binding repeat-containing protein 1 isoform X2 [Denticeps clupeoides]|uniref:Xin actin-binding repeat-containing protein 1-like n=2 Tax=Denticeps clupeoides TaxID=299321 RepID=A0AAY4A987_9TELE|nr:xin actin-binding repeat-containing protein 1-like isoform X2 [Denticeps clupeoides]XP_028833528.1 xin actin-binding repeat-containing protein 1-like isoform X2 [Denticeps clupeoides]